MTNLESEDSKFHTYGCGPCGISWKSVEDTSECGNCGLVYQRENPKLKYTIHRVASNSTEQLFREDDGVMVGCQQKSVVVFGEEPNKRSSRNFVSEQRAIDWLRKQVIEKDLEMRGLAGKPFELEIVDREIDLVMPAGSIDMMMPIPGVSKPTRRN